MQVGLTISCIQGRNHVLKVGEDQPMASAEARACNGGLGADTPVGTRGNAPGRGVSGAKPPEADDIFALESQ